MSKLQTEDKVEVTEEKVLSIDTLWKVLSEHQGDQFLTVKKLPFTYKIRGGEMFVDRRAKSITKATFGKALARLQADPESVTGPKALNVFGAPYIWAVLKGINVIGDAKKETDSDA